MNKTYAPPLFTANYIYACIANFLLNFAFYFVLPIIPIYMMDVFNSDNALIGIVMSCFTVTALLVRPFCGFMLDLFARKPQYLASYICVVAVYLGYTFAASIGTLVLARLAHGLFFGMVTTAGGTIVIDIMPSERRGEGLGYFGMTGNLAMALGPMVGIFLLHTFPHHYEFVFGVSAIICAAGWITALFIKAPPRPAVVKSPLSFDRFILLKGLRGGASLILMAAPYATVTSFAVIYALQLGIEGKAGFFFMFFSAGVIASRIFAGKQIDRGRLLKVIALGTLCASIAFFVLGTIAHLSLTAAQTEIAFYITAAGIGISYGLIFPAYNTLFVNLAPNNRRGTASSTYMTSWDIGIGAGLLLGGQLGTFVGLPYVYMLGAASCLLSLLMVSAVVAPHYRKSIVRHI